MELDEQSNPLRGLSTPFRDCVVRVPAAPRLISAFVPGDEVRGIGKFERSGKPLHWAKIGGGNPSRTWRSRIAGSQTIETQSTQKIRRGIPQLDCGEGIPEDELDAYLTEQKAKPE